MQEQFSAGAWMAQRRQTKKPKMQQQFPTDA
jgi:hypothetical protein